MKDIYYVKEIIRRNEEMILNDIGIACTTKELAIREVEKSIDILKEDKDKFGFGECLSEYSYCDADGLYHLIFTYIDDGRLEYTWRIDTIELIES